MPAIADGSLKLAFAHVERQARYDLFDVKHAMPARPAGGYTIEGDKSVVVHGDSADKLIVSARTSSASRRDRHGISLFLVDANTPGISRRGFATQDGQRGAVHLFRQRGGAGECRCWAQLDHGGELVEQVSDIAIAASVRRGGRLR